MKWKVTLEEQDSGEVIVIEQTEEGKLTCSPVVKKPGAAANTAPKAAPKPETKSETKAAPKAIAKAAPKKAKAKKSPPKVTAATSLDWEPVKDHDYQGIAARSTVGVFKALATKTSQWALFYEQKGVKPRHIGCFKRERLAKLRAQELHDTGWPVSEVVPITAEQVAAACPKPGTDDDEAEAEVEDEAEDESKAKAKAKAPATKPAPKPESDEAAEEALAKSLHHQIVGTVDDDDDDED